MKRMGYRPIQDYGLIGNSRTAGLVSLDGSVDWLCWPRFDSQSIFGALLDDKKGGYFRICPAGEYRSTQEYISETNVLVTIFETAGGHVELIDFLSVGGHRQLCRIIEARSGEMDLRIDFMPRFDYGRSVPMIQAAGRSLIAGSDCGRLELFSGIPLDVSEDAAGTVTTVRAGDKQILVLGEPGQIDRSMSAVESTLGGTVGHWREWLATCPYDGPWREWVTRSALVVKALTYEPSGLAVASPTASLPEQIGGDKNWDYRYVWVRDAAMVLEAMFHLRHMADQGEQYMNFLAKQGGEDPADLRLMYDVDGLPLKGEKLLAGLDGYRGSRPVRIGNAAAFQFQLDTYGELLFTAYRYLEMVGRLSPQVWGTMLTLAEYIIDNWRRPDSGIWEERGRERHYTSSKVMCAVGLQSVLKAQKRLRYPAPTKRWERALAEIEETILERAWNPRLNSFTKFFDSDELDCSLLLMSVYEFLPATDKRIKGTVDALIRNLGRNGFIYRFKWPGEELEEGEGAFAIATMWLAIHFIRLGQLDFAAEFIDAIIGTANHLGLFAEEFDPRTGDFLGNFPQLFVHTALIDAIHSFSDAMEARKAA